MKVTICTNEFDHFSDTLFLDVKTVNAHNETNSYDVILNFAECITSIQNSSRLNDESRRLCETPIDATDANVLAFVVTKFNEIYMSMSPSSAPDEVFATETTFEQ